ncbi:flagellar protein FlaG [bacterium]|nr:flagellar protein FlaG [bacterium]
MMTEGIKQVSPLAPVQGSVAIGTKMEGASHDEAPKKEKEVTFAMASKVAQELNRQIEPSHKVRFHVRDISKTSGNNIVIQILDGEGKVITEIPSEKVKQMAEAVASQAFGEASHGMIVDHVAA